MRAGKIFPKKKFLPCHFSLLAFILRCVIIELRYCILLDLRTFLSNRRSNPARLKNVKFPVFIVSPLEIRRYIGVTKLQKRKISLFLRSKSFCCSFFRAGKREIGRKAGTYG